MNVLSDVFTLVRGLYDLVGGWPGAIMIVLVVSVVPMLVGRPVLGPISRRAGRLKAPTRFMLSDFLWLLIQWQLSLGYCVRFVGIEQRNFFILVLGYLALATVGMWAGSISFLSRAGVIAAGRRAVFILFLLPMTLAVMLSSTFVVLMGLITQLNFVSFEFRHQLDYVLAVTGVTMQMIIAGVVLLPVVAWLLRRVSFWVLSPVTPRPPLTPAIDPASH